MSQYSVFMQTKTLSALSVSGIAGMNMTFCLACLLVSSGCTTLFDGYREERVKTQYQTDSLSSEVAGMKERIQGIEAAQEQLAGEIRELKTYVTRTQAQEREAVERVESHLKQVQAETGRMKEDIIGSLSVKIAEIMRTSSGSTSGGRSSTSGTGRRTADGKSGHVVASGETLRQIASRYGVTAESIMQANNIPDANRIYAGQQLIIPK
jgi:LysM repeat protein